MEHNARMIWIKNREEAVRELRKIGCDDLGVNIMSDKVTFRVIKLERVGAKAANVLKQTMLSKGGEAAVSRNLASFNAEYTDVLLSGTVKQYREAINILRIQPWGLKLLAGEIENLLLCAEKFPARNYTWQDKKSLAIKPGRTLVMGILNITPDSFSDGGKFYDLDAAVRHAEQLIADGADILDIGAESTRPYGSNKVSETEELERLMPVLEKVVGMSPVPISVDTYKASVAKAALKAGAHIINDIWGLQYDPEMAKVAAEFNVPVVMMHNQDGTNYPRDIMSHLQEFLENSVKIGLEAGIEPDKFIIDPGIGFGKTGADNLVIMSRLEELTSLGYPLLLGTSRKLFIGKTLDLPPGDRVEGTGATVAVGILKGAHIVRVHDVKPIARIAKMTDAINFPK
jgi:dihydropteroate synthase